MQGITKRSLSPSVSPHLVITVDRLFMCARLPFSQLMRQCKINTSLWNELQPKFLYVTTSLVARLCTTTHSVAALSASTPGSLPQSTNHSLWSNYTRFHYTLLPPAGSMLPHGQHSASGDGKQGVGEKRNTLTAPPSRRVVPAASPLPAQ